MPLKRSMSFSPILASQYPVWLCSGQSSQTDHKVFINRDAIVIWISYTDWLSATFFQIVESILKIKNMNTYDKLCRSLVEHQAGSWSGEIIRNSLH